MKKKLVPLVAILLSVALVWVLMDGLKGKAQTTDPGDEAIDFTLQDINGKTYSLSDYRGKVVVLNFFATWCQPCLDEGPELEAFNKEFEGAELLLIAKGESNYRIQKFIEEEKSELTYLLDTSEDVSDQYSVTGQPETVIIDKNGKIHTRFSGPTTKQALIEMINEMP